MPRRYLPLLLFITLLSLSTPSRATIEQTYVAHLGELPSLINLDGSGAFFDFIRYIVR